MGIDLTGAGGYQRFCFRAWADAQLLALLHGWAPQGTYIEWKDPPQWMGYHYNANSRQSVRDEDASNMAAALTRALENLVVTIEDAADVDLDGLDWPSVMDDQRPDQELQRRPFATYAGLAGRERVEALIDFCTAGGFRIS
jgi:hypothetical protein